MVNLSVSTCILAKKNSLKIVFFYKCSYDFYVHALNTDSWLLGTVKETAEWHELSERSEGLRQRQYSRKYSRLLLISKQVDKEFIINPTYI